MIKRLEKQERKLFLIVDQQTVRDERLTWQARGILVFLLSMHSDWRVIGNWIALQSPNGKTAVMKALKELERFGYLERKRFQDEKGRWRSDSIIFERSQKPGQDGLPEASTPKDGNQDFGRSYTGFPWPGEPNDEYLDSLSKTKKNYLLRNIELGNIGEEESMCFAAAPQPGPDWSMSKTHSFRRGLDYQSVDKHQVLAEWVLEMNRQQAILSKVPPPPDDPELFQEWTATNDRSAVRSVLQLIESQLGDASNGTEVKYEKLVNGLKDFEH